MAHLMRDKKKLIARVRRINGQLEAVERALARDADCDETLRLIVSARGAMNGLMFEVLEGFIRDHVVAQPLDPASEKARDVEQLVDVVRAYLK